MWCALLRNYVLPGLMVTLLVILGTLARCQDSAKLGGILSQDLGKKESI